MNIQFTSPIFYCPTYEDIFYQRISSLPTYKSIKLVKGQLSLELNELDKETVRQLTDIFSYWDIEPSRLLENYKD